MSGQFDVQRVGMPHPIGIFGRDNMSFDRMPILPFDFTQNQNLVDVAKENDLAVAQLPFLCIPMDTSLVAAYISETGKEIVPRFVEVPQLPIAVGHSIVLGAPVAWDYRVTVLPKDSAKDWIAWLGTVAIHDPRTGRGYRIRPKQLRITDVIAAAKLTTLSDATVTTIEVPVLCVESTLGAYYYEQKVKAGLTYPVLRHDPNAAFDSLNSFVQSVRAGQSDPYGAFNASTTPELEGGRPDLSGGRADDP